MIGAETLLVVLLCTPFAASLAVAFLQPHARTLAAGIAIGAMLIAVVLTAIVSKEMTGAEPVRFTADWADSLGLEFSLWVNGFSWIFLFLISGIGLLVCIYARYYMPPADPVPRFFSLLLAFAGSMIGLVLSANVIQLFMFWEMTSVLSFLLIGYWH